MRRWSSLLSAALFASALVACGSQTPRANGVVPNRTLQLSPSVGMAMEKVVFWGAYMGVAYLVLDPLAPNWEIEEAPLAENHIHLSMRMKRYHIGGAGESRPLFHRRARELVHYGGFEGYEIVEYGEGVESSVIGSRRVATGVIRLKGSGAAVPPNQGADEPAAPARMTPASASNPLS